MLLDRKALLTKQPLEKVKVDLGNDDFVYVKEMTGHERDLFEQSLSKEVVVDGKTEYKRALEDFRAKLAVCVICDENGNTILQPNDYVAFSRAIGIKRLEKIIAEAQKLNKISDEDKETLLKNSAPAQDDNSNSGSVEN